MLYLVNRKKYFITLQTVFEIGSFLFKKNHLPLQKCNKKIKPHYYESIQILCSLVSSDTYIV
jgi:hypothetical protein